MIGQNVLNDSKPAIGSKNHFRIFVGYDSFYVGLWLVEMYDSNKGLWLVWSNFVGYDSL